MREEKKYEILPGVEIPDMKKIQEAASDFSVSDVGDVEIKAQSYEMPSSISDAVMAAVTAAELAQLQSLGTKVAEDEARSQAESRAKMDKIMSKSVQAPESIGDLKASHIAQVNEEKRKQLEEQEREAQKLKAEEEAKNKAREERRQLQQKLMEESRQKAEQERLAREQAEKEQADKEQAELERIAMEEAARLAAPVEERMDTQAEAEQPVAEQPIVTQPAAVEPAEETAVIKIDAADFAPAEPKPVEQPAIQQPAAQKPAEQPVEQPKNIQNAEPAVEEKSTASIASAEETFADFKEFLGDDGF